MISWHLRGYNLQWKAFDKSYTGDVLDGHMYNLFWEKESNDFVDKLMNLPTEPEKTPEESYKSDGKA